MFVSFAAYYFAHMRAAGIADSTCRILARMRNERGSPGTARYLRTELIFGSYSFHQHLVSCSSLVRLAYVVRFCLDLFVASGFTGEDRVGAD
jgi:hypothetical protein